MHGKVRRSMQKEQKRRQSHSKCRNPQKTPQLRHTSTRAQYTAAKQSRSNSLVSQLTISKRRRITSEGIRINDLAFTVLVWFMHPNKLDFWLPVLEFPINSRLIVVLLSMPTRALQLVQNSILRRHIDIGRLHQLMIDLTMADCNTNLILCSAKVILWQFSMYFSKQ